MAMRATIRKLGNSSGIIIPKSILAEIGIAAGDPVDLSLEDGHIAITPVKRRPREGWAEAFGEVPELGDEDRAWLEFGNDFDADLKW
jgi:antitoxin MazE